MAGEKFLKNVDGTHTETPATQTGGAGNEDKIAALDNTGRFDPSMLPVGVTPETKLIQASEALTAGDFVNIHNVAGAFRVRKADASTTKPAHGFVLAGVASAANATVFLEGMNTGVSGATPGQQYLSDSVPGGFAASSPTGAGKISQRIGTAVSATEINFEPQPEIVLAA